MEHTDGIGVWKDKLKPIDPTLVEGILVQNLDIEQPRLQVFAINKLNARRETVIRDLLSFVSLACR